MVSNSQKPEIPNFAYFFFGLSFDKYCLLEGYLYLHLIYLEFSVSKESDYDYAVACLMRASSNGNICFFVKCV